MAHTRKALRNLRLLQHRSRRMNPVGWRAQVLCELTADKSFFACGWISARLPAYSINMMRRCHADDPGMSVISSTSFGLPPQPSCFSRLTALEARALDARLGRFRSWSSQHGRVFTKKARASGAKPASASGTTATDRPSRRDATSSYVYVKPNLTRHERVIAFDASGSVSFS
jgi:hypothetical protein